MTTDHVLSEEELRIPEHPDRPAMKWMSIELDTIRRYGNAAYQLGIERGKEREFICARCGIRQDSKPSGESPF